MRVRSIGSAALVAVIVPALLSAQPGAARPGAARGSSVPRDSAAFAGAAVLRLANGATSADVIGDRSPGIVLVAVKGNYNAHGYHAVAIAVRPRVANPDSSAWQLVSTIGSARGAGDVLGTEEGADCTLRDVRLLRRSAGRPLTLVIGQRAMRGSYADADSVRFTVYELRHNAGGVVGFPTYYFEPTQVIRPARAYCDVNVAFGRELGLGRAGVAPSEASADGR